jgi:uncharacterized protein YbjT (DUF2867 family)
MIVVTGATGNVGRPLVAELARRGHDVAAVSRAGTAPLAAPRVRGVSADLSDPGSLHAVVDGASAVFLLVPGTGGHLDSERIVGSVVEAGVRRLVLVSSQAAGTRPGSAAYRPMAKLEELVHTSGVGWTVLRPAGFYTNAFAWIPSVRAERTVHAPFGSVALPGVDPLDIADVAAAALTEDRHDGRTYELTGPSATTPRERTDALAKALGAPLVFTELSREEAYAGMREVMPKEIIDGTLAILGEPTARERAVSRDVDAVLGRPPRTFADWAVRHAAMFAA